MTYYISGPKKRNLDSLIDVKGFSAVPGGKSVCFKRDKTGLPFNPSEVEAEPLSLGPSGGLSYNALNQLGIKLDEPSDLNLSENGLKFDNPMTRDLDIGGFKVKNLNIDYPPLSNSDATSWYVVSKLNEDSYDDLKEYIDNRTDRVKCIAKIGYTTTDHEVIDLSAQTHVTFGGLFKNIIGTGWVNGKFIAPKAGVYSVAMNFRIKCEDVAIPPFSIGNIYTSINGNVNYALSTNIVYLVYNYSGDRNSWNTFHISGLLDLNHGDAVDLVSSYGDGFWTFHTTAVFQIARVSI